MSDSLARHLDARNRSILAHGFVPARREHYENLFHDALQLLNIPEQDLTAFPVLNLEA